MDHDKLIAFSEDGLFSGGLGPEAEWDPVDPITFQRRHDEFWRFTGDILQTEYTDEGNDEDLPEWMSEEATITLRNN